MKVRFVPPGRCLLREPPERGEAQRIPRYHPRVRPIVYHLFCPTCGGRVVVCAGITETDPHDVETEIETSDGGVRLVRHLCPVLSVEEQACSCGSRWCVANGEFVFAEHR